MESEMKPIKGIIFLKKRFTKNKVMRKKLTYIINFRLSDTMLNVAISSKIVY